MKNLIAISLGMLSLSAFAAPNLIVTPVSTSSGSQIAVDLVTDVALAAIQFDLVVSGQAVAPSETTGRGESVAVSGETFSTDACVSGSEVKNLAFRCNQKGNRVRVVIANLTGGELAAGSHQIGSLSTILNGSVAVENIEFTARDGSNVEGSSSVAK